MTTTLERREVLIRKGVISLSDLPGPAAMPPGPA